MAAGTLAGEGLHDQAGWLGQKERERRRNTLLLSPAETIRRLQIAPLFQRKETAAKAFTTINLVK